MNISEFIKEGEALAEKATKGPWDGYVDRLRREREGK